MQPMTEERRVLGGRHVLASVWVLGERNWYLPSWLRWLPDAHIEGSHIPPSVAHPRRRHEPART
jgi:hypothetical protein